MKAHLSQRLHQSHVAVGSLQERNMGRKDCNFGASQNNLEICVYSRMGKYR